MAFSSDPEMTRAGSGSAAVRASRLPRTKGAAVELCGLVLPTCLLLSHLRCLIPSTNLPMTFPTGAPTVGTRSAVRAAIHPAKLLASGTPSIDRTA